MPPPFGPMLTPKQYRCSLPAETCRQMQDRRTTEVVKARMRSISSMGTTCPKCLTCCLAVTFLRRPFQRKSGITSSAFRLLSPFARWPGFSKNLVMKRRRLRSLSRSSA